MQRNLHKRNLRQPIKLYQIISAMLLYCIVYSILRLILVGRFDWLTQVTLHVKAASNVASTHCFDRLFQFH